jgi:hypothetical protein
LLGLLAQFKKALKIRSPSKVFFEIGGDIVDGLAFGFGCESANGGCGDVADCSDGSDWWNVVEAGGALQ